MARREEWQTQTEVAARLSRWLPAVAFWTAVDTVPRSAANGFMRRLRGCRSGVPDILILYRGKLITIELKSRHGEVNPAQRAVREALLRAGAVWWLCKSVKP